MYINKSHKPVSLPDSHYPGSSATATNISKNQLYIHTNNHSISHDAQRRSHNSFPELHICRKSC